jgi:hypothetical protein
MAVDSCPICGTRVNAAQHQGTKDTMLFDCPRCGTYEIPGLQRTVIPPWFEQQPHFGPVLSHYVRIQNKTEKWPMIGQLVLAKIEADPSLPNPAEQADNLVLFLGDSLHAAGQMAELNEPVHGAIIGSRNGEEFRFIVRSLKQMGLIETPNEARQLDVTLSFAGWSKLNRLRQPALTETPTRERSPAASDVPDIARVVESSGAPRAFISHATEDKERFVVELAKRLRAKGVNAWLDQWEMLPGDSLVSKIFDQGIGEADCVVVVLSHTSVTKRWVREELEAAIVRSIKENVRVIPLLIDDCEVPKSLRSKVWLRIADPAAYDSEFEKLVGAIFQQTTRPPLGPPPAYAARDVSIGGLDGRDSLVLAEACRRLIAHGKSDVSPIELLSDLESKGMTVERIMDSAEVLAEDGLVKTSSVPGVRVMYFSVTPRGVRQFASSTLDVPKLESEILALVVDGMLDSAEIGTAISQPEVIVHSLLHGLAPKGLEVRDFSASNAPLGRRTEVISVSPRLRRRLG